MYRFWSFFYAFFALLASMMLAESAMARQSSNHVLLVVSGYGAEEGEARPGFEMDELAQAHAVFIDNGFSVDIASPSGGSVVADRYDPDKPYNKRFLSDASASAALKTTLRLAELDPNHYDAVFVIGGKGAMFDLPVDTDLKRILATIYGSGGVIGAVCHGPMVLANLRLSDGSALIAGRKVTGFTNEEELLFGKRWVPAFPVLLEDALKGAGASFSEAPIMLNHVVTDGRLVTGQNPYSTASTAEAMIIALGKTPERREPFADERSMAIIATAISGGRQDAEKLLESEAEDFDAPLIAIWGYYRALQAGTDREMLKQGLMVMDLIRPYFSAPELDQAIADARKALAVKP